MSAKTRSLKVTAPHYFARPSALRQWLERNHASAAELWVGFHKKASGKPSVTYPEALDQALCFGWIDGVRKSLNATSYTIRFTPRKPISKWSAVNVRHAERLKAAGLMRPSGIAEFVKRGDGDGPEYSYESAPRELSAEYRREFAAKATAWEFFQSQPPGYRRVSQFWVMSAKREETRRRRLASLIDCSVRGQRIPQLARPAPSAKPLR